MSESNNFQICNDMIQFVPNEAKVHLLCKDALCGIDLFQIEEIVNIDLDMCVESFPCDHTLTVRMKDGSVKTNDYFEGPEIAFLYTRFGKEVPEHFVDYMCHARYNQLIAIQESENITRKW